RNPITKANSSKILFKKLGINHVSAWQILREDHGLKPYKFQKRQKLTANVKGPVSKTLVHGMKSALKYCDRSWMTLQGD
uniref:Transposase n=1 Tax=Acrobeloides nanus TaxID=290746 RepID=A0A914D3U7_9BILA